MPKKPTIHSYTDLEAFQRLMLLIATLILHPGIGSNDCSNESNTKSEDHRDAVMEVLVHLQQVACDCGYNLPNYSVHTLRKDLQVLRRYNILDRRMYRWGYYLGTGVMSWSELRVALNALASQVKYQQDPEVNKIYQKLIRRLRGLNLAEDFTYPVRSQINR